MIRPDIDNIEARLKVSAETKLKLNPDLENQHQFDRDLLVNAIFDSAKIANDQRLEIKRLREALETFAVRVEKTCARLDPGNVAHCRSVIRSQAKEARKALDPTL